MGTFGDLSDRHLCLRGSLYSHLEMSRMHRYLQPFYTIAVKCCGKAKPQRSWNFASNQQSEMNKGSSADGQRCALTFFAVRAYGGSSTAEEVSKCAFSQPQNYDSRNARRACGAPARCANGRTLADASFERVDIFPTALFARMQLL